MKKVGILTFNNAINYGALCQMYGLYTVLSGGKDDVKVINYTDLTIENRYKLFQRKGNLKSDVKELLFYFVRLREKKAFVKFKERIALTVPVSDAELQNLTFDSIVVGSDQVWNLTLTNNNLTYYLGWFEGQKYSYAASFGVNEFDDNFEKRINQLKDFDKISVREENARVFLNGLQIQSYCNIDPVFLLDSKEWKNISIKPVYRKPYLLIYTIGYSDEIIAYAKAYATKNNLKIVYIADDVLYKKGIKVVRGVSPEEWIGLFCYADCVITNSFHGTAFSIIFNKTFFCDFVKTNFKNTNTRIDNMLKKFGIKNRNIHANINDIDWQQVNERIQKEREKSLNYLNSI